MKPALGKIEIEIGGVFAYTPEHLGLSTGARPRSFEKGQGISD
jgi:hypothetical protein